jgi:hypothetical protein
MERFSQFKFYWLFFFCVFMNGNSFGFEERILIVSCPTPIYPDHYQYDLRTTFVNPVNGWEGMEPRSFNVQFNGINRDQMTKEYEIWSTLEGDFLDTLIRIKYTISNTYSKTGRYRAGTYVYLDTVISINKDTVWFNIPPIENAAEIISYLEEADKVYQIEHRGEDFSAFMNSFQSRFLTLSYFQGHRPFAEISFGTAHYAEMKKNLFTGSDVAGLIAGPTIGSEFNFRWNANEFILGPKIGVNASIRILNLGMHLIYYTDFEKGSLFLTPRIGICPGNPYINFSYAYGFRLGHDKFGSAINRHQFCLFFYIPVKRVVN